MDDLILKSLKEAIERYPEIVPFLKGKAKIASMVYSIKQGEAPDDDQRRADEEALKQEVYEFLQNQLGYIMEEPELRAFVETYWDEHANNMYNLLMMLTLTIFFHGVAGAIAALPPAIRQTIDREQINKGAMQVAGDYEFNLIKNISDTTRQQTQDAIRKWMQSGQPLSELSKALEPIYGKIRAELIASTEVTRLYAWADYIAWKASGTTTQYRWMTAEDELVCEICQPLNGKLFPLEQLIERPPAHPRCRCWAQPIVDEDLFEQQLREIMNG